MPSWYCPSCTAPNVFPDPGEGHLCSYCGVGLPQEAVVCPNCGQVWPAENLDNCPACDEPLSTIGRVMYRHEQAGRPPRWLERSREGAGEIKEQGMARSALRMQQFEAIESERQAHLRQAKIEQDRKDRDLIVIGIAVGLLAAGALIVVALL